MVVQSFLVLVRSIVSPLLDLAFPPLCRVCGDAIENASDLLCSACQTSLVLLQPHDSVYDDALKKLTQSGVIEGVVSLYPFEKAAPLQSLIHALKYDGATSIGSVLGSRLGVRVIESTGACAKDVIVPIPLHKARLRERGYNQSAVIAKGMSQVCGAPVDADLLLRRRNTVSQTTLSLRERRTNVAGAFSVRAGGAGQLHGKKVFLVDDVVTTGSTMLECARLLRENGARAVIGCSLALAARDSNS